MIDDIKIIAIDVDGVLTDGNYYLSETGAIHKSFYTRDFYALDRCIQDDIKIVIITGSSDKTVNAKVGCKSITVINQSKNKYEDLEKYLLVNRLKEKRNSSKILGWDNIAYIGDAENDYECIKKSRLPTCPSDAIQEIKDLCSYISPCKGGQGAVYDIVRYIYKNKNKKWIAD